MAVKNHAESSQSCYTKLEKQFNGGKHLLDCPLAQIKMAAVIFGYPKSVAKNASLDHLLNSSIAGTELRSRKHNFDLLSL